MSSNLKVNSLVPATGTEIGIGTTGGSIDFRCAATFGGNVTIGGTLTYDEVINIDSIGVITARSNIDCNGSLDVDGHTDLDNVSISGIVTVSNTAPGVHFIDTNANSDFMAQVDTGVFKIVDLTNSSATRVVINSAGKLGINEVNPTEMLHIKAEDNTDNFGGIIIYANNNSVYTKHGWRGLDSNEAIRFAISGTEKMRLTNGGKLALGRSGADEMIHITHDDNSDHYGGIKIAANNNSVHVKYGWRGIDGSETLRFGIGGTEKLRLDSNGKFLYGIGTARSGFFNTASQFNPHFQIEGAGDADDPGRVTSIIYNSTTTAGPTLLFGKTNTGSVGGTGAVANNHGLGLITFQGMVGGQFTQGATIGASVSGTPGDNDLPTHLSFGTCADGAASASERLRITSAGYLKMPDDAHIHLGGAQSGAGDLQIYHDSTANFNNIQSLAGSNLRIRQQSNGAGLYLAATHIYLQNHNNNQTYLHAQNGGSVTLNYSGNARARTDANGFYISRVNTFSNPNNTGSETLGAMIDIGGNIHLQEVHPTGAYTDRCDLVLNTNSGYGLGLSDKLRITAGGQVIVGGNVGHNESAALLSVHTDASTGANMLSDSSAIYNHNNPAFLHIANRYNTGTGQEAGIILHSKNSHNGSWAIYSKRSTSSYLADLIFRCRTGGSSSAQRFRMNSSGMFGCNGNPNRYLHVYGRTDGGNFGTAAFEQNNTGNNAAVMFMSTLRNGSSSESFLQCNRDQDNNGQGVRAVFFIRTNGDVDSDTNSYGGISDIKLKENIVDAKSQWDDIKNIKVRNFNFKDNPDQKMLGVVAQEIETVCSGLVKETPDQNLTSSDSGDEGTSTKSVKYSILYMKAIKALQEAQTRIETLEAKVSALEGS